MRLNVIKIFSIPQEYFARSSLPNNSYIKLNVFLMRFCNASSVEVTSGFGIILKRLLMNRGTCNPQPTSEASTADSHYNNFLGDSTITKNFLTIAQSKLLCYVVISFSAFHEIF